MCQKNNRNLLKNEHVLHDDFWITEDKAKRVHNDSIEL